jgi:biopolymer transport protein TolR
MNTGNGRDPLMSEINVTPFVDVMLVLLIIFMVTAPMMTQGLDVNLPEATADSIETETEQLIVSLTKDNLVFINDVQVTPFQFKEKLLTILQGDLTREVFLKADKDVPYGRVIYLMSEIRGAGIEKLGVITEPPGDEEDGFSGGKS